MAIQWLDIIVIGIMAFSGLLALARGFTREVLSLIAWGLAAVAGLLAAFNPELVSMVGEYIKPERVAQVVLGAVVFLVVLIIVSLISVRLADWVLDSAAGPFDRTLGFFYGLARGFLLIVIAYLFYVWLVPLERREDWVRNAWSLPVIERGGDVVLAFLPVGIADTLKNLIAEGSTTTETGKTSAEGEGNEGYKSNQTRVLDQLIESTQSGQQKSDAPQQSQQAPADQPEDPEEVPSFGSETDQSGQN
ncbi:MAG: CvpA family protein [Parvibaculaceae bacterium]